MIKRLSRLILPFLLSFNCCLNRLEHGVYNLSRMREAAMKRYKGFQIPWEWMLETGYVSQVFYYPFVCNLRCKIITMMLFHFSFCVWLLTAAVASFRFPMVLLLISLSFFFVCVCVCVCKYCRSLEEISVLFLKRSMRFGRLFFC